MTRYRLGKLPAKHSLQAFKFGEFFDRSKLPVPPVRFGHHAQIKNWGMLGNDVYGNCVWAGAAHETRLWGEVGAADVDHPFTTENTLADYAAVTGFKLGDADTDNGTDMADAAKYRRKTGIIDANGDRHTIDSYVALRIGNIDDLALATYLGGAVGVGLMLPESAMRQFDDGRRWTIDERSETAGGHYVSCVGRNSIGDFLVITWGRLHAMSPTFYRRYSDEALAYLSLEMLSEKKLSPEGFDADGLKSALGKLGRRSE